jgi:hypothetical protein
MKEKTNEIMDFRAEAEKVANKIMMDLRLRQNDPVETIESSLRRCWDEAVEDYLRVRWDKTVERMLHLKCPKCKHVGKMKIVSLESIAPTKNRRPLKKDPSLGPGQEWHG